MIFAFKGWRGTAIQRDTCPTTTTLSKEKMTHKKPGAGLGEFSAKINVSNKAHIYSIFISVVLVI
jgi:hypothetical protein